MCTAEGRTKSVLKPSLFIASSRNVGLSYIEGAKTKCVSRFQSVREKLRLLNHTWCPAVFHAFRNSSHFIVPSEALQALIARVRLQGSHIRLKFEQSRSLSEFFDACL